MIVNTYTGGGIFDTGPQFVFNVGGGPGVRVHQFGGGGPRRRPGTAQAPGSQPAPSVSSTLSALLPLLFLFVLPLLSSIFGSGSAPQGPQVRFEQPQGAFSQLRTSTAYHKIPYWVKPSDVNGYSKADWKTLDRQAEERYVHIVSMNCDKERLQQARLEQEAQGWFFMDGVKMQQARDLPMPSCKRLRELGVMRY
jgi:DnaJ family protein B protein 12